MKPSIEILRGFGSFTRVITQGKRYERRPVKAFVLFSRSEKPAVRVGFAVARSFGKATLRNRAKRLMREAFRANKEQFIGRICGTYQTEIVFLLNDSSSAGRKNIQFDRINKSIEGICSSIVVLNE